MKSIVNADPFFQLLTPSSVSLDVDGVTPSS